MPLPRSLRLIPAIALVAACADGPTDVTPEPPPPPQVVGLYEFTLSDVGAPTMSGTAGLPRGGPSRVLTPLTTGITFELVSSSSFTEGTRGRGGQRYISVTYRVRNNTGVPLSNLSAIPASSASTIPGTPFTVLTVFNGSAASTALAAEFAPTGAVTLGGGAAMKATEVDVLQVFNEAEVAAITPPAGVTGLFPYGFVVRNPSSDGDRTIPVAETANDYQGLVTFAFRYPLTASAASDPFLISFQALLVEDSETRMTESIEEAQDTAAVRRIRERAAALGATTVTVLPGSGAAAADVADYPGQRQICTVRTSGSAASPARFITNPAAYTVLRLRRPGETGSACGADFRTGTPADVLEGEPISLTLVATDRYGNVMTDVDSVQLDRVAGPAVTAGPRVALVAGEAAIEVTYAGAGSSLLRAVGRRVRTEHGLEVLAAGTVQAFAGGVQGAMSGTAVPTPPAVRILDGNGDPIAGRSVTFAVATGGGSVTGPTAVTNASGVAAVGSWTLGTTAQLNTLTASVDGAGVAGGPITFSAAGCENGAGGGYQVTVCYASEMTSSQRAAFANAAGRWGTVITGDLADVAAPVAAGQCSSGSPALNMTMDDLLVIAHLNAIDGAGGTLGSAGPCLVRASGSLPVVATLRLDVADAVTLEGAGQLGPVVLHEMGHAIGIGALWPLLGYLQSPSSAGSPLDTYYSGANGIAGFNSIGGATYTGGQKVPVENTGVAGTINAHWRESVLANELMTGFLSSGVANPLSLLTVRSLSDLGYTVSTVAADPFFLTLSAPPARGGGVPMGDDVHLGPLYQVDPRGGVTRLR